MREGRWGVGVAIRGDRRLSYNPEQRLFKVGGGGERKKEKLGHDQKTGSLYKVYVYCMMR